MHLIPGINHLDDEHRPCVATIGNFDGVHRGHETVIATLLLASKKMALPSTVVTFAPLAKEFFAPQNALRLQPLAQRCERLFELGVNQVLVVDFDAELASYSPAKFVESILVAGLGVRYLSVGDDFKFGHQRAGDFQYLQSAGEQAGFQVEAHPTHKLDGERVSSGRLRDAVGAANFSLAERLLGRPYTIRGVVSRGEQRGRTIGFPTANIVLDAAHYAVHGVYAVKASHAGRTYGGVANVGSRPTVDGQENRLEVHLFEFDQDVYEQSLEVEFVAKIRAEKKFESFDALHQQIQQDAEAAKLLLQAP